MSKKNKKEKKLASKPLMVSQVELLAMKVQLFNQVNQLWRQRKEDIDNAVIVIARELGVPEDQLGEWGITQDGKTLVRFGKGKRFPGIRTTVKKRPQKKKKTSKGQEAESDE